jgi:hypothetical protein
MRNVLRLPARARVGARRESLDLLPEFPVLMAAVGPGQSQAEALARETAPAKYQDRYQGQCPEELDAFGTITNAIMDQVPP